MIFEEISKMALKVNLYTISIFLCFIYGTLEIARIFIFLLISALLLPFALFDYTCSVKLHL